MKKFLKDVTLGALMPLFFVMVVGAVYLSLELGTYIGNNLENVLAKEQSE